MKFNWKKFVYDRYDPHVLIPWWKGYVRHDYVTGQHIVAIIPFNIIFCFTYNFYLWVRIIGKDTQKFLTEQIKIRGDN